MHRSFEAELENGKMGESLIAHYWLSLGYSILPVYEKQIGEYKGPTLFRIDGTLVAPDMLALGGVNNIVWVEAKHKSAFAWHRIRGIWTTGIDLHHYQQYLRVQEVTQLPVWLMFLHKPGNVASGTPDELKGKSPSGLFGGPLSTLAHCEDHRWPKPMKGQPHGMVYWDYRSLMHLASYDDLLRLLPQPKPEPDYVPPMPESDWFDEPSFNIPF